MRTTLEIPDPLFARLKARAASEHLTLKQLLDSYEEQGLSTMPERTAQKRSAQTLPRLEWLLPSRVSKSAMLLCSICWSHERYSRFTRFKRVAGAGLP